MESLSSFFQGMGRYGSSNCNNNFKKTMSAVMTHFETYGENIECTGQFETIFALQKINNIIILQKVNKQNSR